MIQQKPRVPTYAYCRWRRLARDAEPFFPYKRIFVMNFFCNEFHMDFTL